ncbi:MAG: alpha-mannosidase, partial [Planctomycetes bacterium]|nr:alpha-mannosidase [Planctomycetota bacterium]
QSSAALYVATEENFPDVFERMKKYVAEGRWDIVGGRWCEGDTNMISAESHARHLLYGQRYFREKFGKTAIVGWEPDTFGHCATMPAILRAGGLRYYYFCRAGKGKPLFQWEAPDGSKVLAFEEPATGSWYNSDVTEKFIEELFPWEDATGAKDLLWVYGVGNHGGGPTREQIATALDWQKSPGLPTVKFATAETFFTTLEKKADLTRVPTIKDELNFVFRGCYTTHGDMKRWNRDAESQTVAAESLATCAWLEGAPYPGAEFASMWKDITWNHHHDTLPGTSIHPSYKKSRAMFEAVLASDRDRLRDATARLARIVGGNERGAIVFNSLPFPRSEWVELDTTKEEADRIQGADVLGPVPSDGGRVRVGFVAEQVPALGVHVAWLRSGSGVDKVGLARAKDDVLETDQLRVAIDPETGALTSIRDLKNGREILGAGEKGLVFEAHWEKPHGMSAWQIGDIEKIEPLLSRAQVELVHNDPFRVTSRITRKFHDSTITTDVSLTSGLPRVDFETTIDWKEKGGEDHAAPFLKVAFPLAVSPDAVATYEIPFGSIERPRNGDEVPALRWVDVGDAKSGVALLNDCKHGHSVKDNVLRLSLVRASYYPDPEPDQYVQKIRYALVPHAGSWKDADVVRQAASFNTPLVATMGTVASAAQHSFLDVEPSSVIPTGVKKAEDSDAVIVRIYESRGDPVRATLTFDRAIVSAETVNFVEDLVPGPRPKLDGSKLEQPLRPYDIQTLRVRLAPKK